jgi:hypothetical protein
MDDASQEGLGPGPTLAERLHWIARALFVAYVLSVVFESFPLQLSYPGWRLNVANTLVDNATIPLIGLGLIHLGVYIDPINPFLQKSQRRVTSLAVAASLGFLLIIPFQLGSTVMLYADLSASRFKELDRSDQRLVQLSSAIQATTTVDQLEATLISLQGSTLSSSDRDQPLNTLRNILLERIRQARNVLKEKRRELSTPLDPGLLVRRSLRVVLTSLFFAIAYAACAQRPNRPVSLLVELQAGSLFLLEGLAQRREQRLALRAEREQQRQEEERLAAFEALRRQQLELEAQDDADRTPWVAPPSASFEDYYIQIMGEQHPAATQEARSDGTQDSPPPLLDRGARSRMPAPGSQRSVDAINEYLDQLAQDGQEEQDAEPGTPPSP